MSILNNLTKQFSSTNSANIGQAMEELVDQAVGQRRAHERRWYDNNFFDDGYHFRTISKKTGKVVDHVNSSQGYVERAIPRASRQIRGVTNLLFAAEPYPVVYPERVLKSKYPDIPDPKTGKPMDNPEYTAAVDQAKKVARMRGLWLSTEWDEGQHLPIKLIDLLILAAKNSVSWLQVYSDPRTQTLITEVYDAFDVVIYGDKRETKELPFMTKIKPMDFKEVLSNPMFDPAMLRQLTPDNKYATSEIKDAYMRARYGAKQTTKDQSTILVKESFIKEVLTDENWKQAVKLGEANGAMEGKSRGDMIMRHPFSAGGVTLLDEYVDYDEYPLIPIRFEPGPLYQVPFIERFIPQNKSIDVVITRLEKWINAMIVGVYQKRKGENFQVSNFPGGQMVEYETTPLTQMQNGSVGQTPFAVVELLNKFIDEQGASTSTLAQLPQGVKSGIAIESVKSSEYSNLKIPILMLKQSIKEIAERMLERGHKDILEPQEYSSVEDGDPEYFDVIGKRGYDLSQQVHKELPEDIVVLDKKVKVRIEIEPGLGLTMEGKRQAMQEIIKYMLEIMNANPDFIPGEALKQVIKRFLETFGYGSTQEFMEVMDEASDEGVSDDTIQKIKIALLESLEEAEEIGPKGDQKDIQAAQIGTLQALKDSGIADKIMEEDQPVMDPKTEVEIQKIQQEMQIKQEEHELKMAQMQQEMAIKEASVGQDLAIKEESAKHNQVVTDATTKQDMKLKDQSAKLAAQTLKQKNAQKPTTKKS